MDYGQGVLVGDSRPTPQSSFCSLRSASAGPGLVPSLIRIASITDGTSNTSFVSEILQGASDDIRGAIWVDNAGAGYLHDAVHAQRLPGLCSAHCTLVDRSVSLRICQL